MSSLGILGCGWLGVPLGKHLQTLNYNIKGSCRSEEGISNLNNNGIKGYQVVLEENQTTGVKSFIDKLETLIISIPPGRKFKEGVYVKMIKNLLEKIEPTPLKRIIFLSSTSVYGSSGGVYNESSFVNPETSSAKALHICENLIINSPLSSVIVRLGGLIGEDRNPIFQLQGKAIGNPLGCINFIHQDDAINGISNLVINSRLEGIFNLVSPHHPLRKKYYDYSAIKFSLPTPKYTSEPAVIRIIKASKITELTSFKYNVDNMLI